MKNFYLAVQEEHTGKYFAFVIRYYNCNNLLATLEQYPNLKTVNICESKKQAEELATRWNEGYKANGTYLFD